MGKTRAFEVEVRFRVEADWWPYKTPGSYSEEDLQKQVAKTVQALIKRLFKGPGHKWIDDENEKYGGHWEKLPPKGYKIMQWGGRVRLQPTGEVRFLGESVCYPEPAPAPKKG